LPATTSTGRTDKATIPFSAARKPLAVVLFLVVMLGGLAADLWTKHAAFDALLSQPIVETRVYEIRQYHGEIPPDEMLQRLRLQRDMPLGMQLHLSTNDGVAFGMQVPPWLVGVVTVLIIGLIGYFFATSEARAWPVHVALGMILAGALGNFYDRLLGVVELPGYQPITNQVRDFIDFSQLKLEIAKHTLDYPYIFNVADVLLVVGPAILIIHWLVAAIRERKAAKAPAKG
jgi:signal peptidase II